MRLEHYPLEKLDKDLVDIISQYLDLKKYQLFYFGSRVLDKGDQRSDIDVGIKGPKSVPIQIMSKLHEAIEDLSTLYKVDLVDFHKLSPDFKKTALTKIRKINV